MQISHKNTVTYTEGYVTLEIMTTHAGQGVTATDSYRIETQDDVVYLSANEFSDLKRIFQALTGAGDYV